MPSFGLFVLAAIVASSAGIYVVGSGISLANGFLSLYQQYYGLQRLMLVYMYAKAYGSSNASFMTALNASLGMDGLSMVQQNGSAIIYVPHTGLRTAIWGGG